MRQPRNSHGEMSPSKLHQVTYPALISSDICHFTASGEVKSNMFPFSSPTANIRLMKTSAHTFNIGYDELIRCIRRRECNGSGSVGELDVCHCGPFSEIAIKRLPYFDLSPWVRVNGPCVVCYSKKRQLNRLIPRCGCEDLPVGCPSPIPNYPSV